MEAVLLRGYVIDYAEQCAKQEIYPNHDLGDPHTNPKEVTFPYKKLSVIHNI